MYRRYVRVCTSMYYAVMMITVLVYKPMADELTIVFLTITINFAPILNILFVMQNSCLFSIAYFKLKTYYHRYHQDIHGSCAQLHTGSARA